VFFIGAIQQNHRAKFDFKLDTNPV